MIFLLSKIKADGLYISAHNKNLLLNIFSKKGFIIIGSAHNQKEIDLKLSRVVKKLFFQDFLNTNIKIKKGHLGIQKFNIISLRKKRISSLGGINEKKTLIN